jgi:hypothetical protein
MASAWRCIEMVNGWRENKAIHIEEIKRHRQQWQKAGNQRINVSNVAEMAKAKKWRKLSVNVK